MDPIAVPSGSRMDPIAVPCGSGMDPIAVPCGSVMGPVVIPSGSGMGHNEGDCVKGTNNAKKSDNGRKRKWPAKSKGLSKHLRTDSGCEATTINTTPSQAMKRFTNMCCDILHHKVMSAVAYGAEADIYRPRTIGDMELSSPQCLLLTLLHSLVRRDVTACVLLADICRLVEKLRSRHLLENFAFPRADIVEATTLLSKMVEDGVINLPAHVLMIMASLAVKYGVTDVQLRTLTDESRISLATELENAVVNNKVKDIFELQSEGADVCRLNQSGDSLLHLAARSGCTASIAALGFLNAEMEVVNSSNATPLEEAVRCDSAPSVIALLKAGANSHRRLLKGDTYLHIAAAGGHNGALGALLEGGMRVNETNHIGETALAQAIRAGNYVGIKLLIDKGADNSILHIVKLNEGDSIVHSLARSGNLDILKLLRDKGFNADIKNQSGQTPLHVANNPSVVKMLLRMGVSVNSLDNNGKTPLIMAAKENKVDIVNILLLNKADPMIKDKQGFTALHYAAEEGCSETVTSLLDAGAMVYDIDNEGDTPAFIAAVNMKTTVLKLLMEMGDLSVRDQNGDAILHHETRRGHVEVITALLDARVPVDMKGQNGKTALHIAAERKFASVVKVILSFGAAVNMKDPFQKTALHYAVITKDSAVVKMLLDAGAAMDLKDNQEMTPLHYAAEGCHDQLAKVLLDAGATVDAIGKDKKTALHIAAEKKCAAVVKVLLSLGASVNMNDSNLRTALHYAVITNVTHTPINAGTSSIFGQLITPPNMTVVKSLLDAGAETNLKDSGGETALHYVARGTNIEILKVLLDTGAMVNIKNSEGKTALHLAVPIGDISVITELLDRGAEVNAKDNYGFTPLRLTNGRRNIENYLRSRGGTT